MTHAALSQVIGTALVDDGFRRVLLRNPREALASFNLASDELMALSRIRANTLEQFAAQVVTWFSEADRSRSA
ncbi:MAG: Franean1_4349 family RiPP [Anaerolineae bacterium]|nr:Franean1_4349 family RiPP [Anaerolineae bacterium]